MARSSGRRSLVAVMTALALLAVPFPALALFAVNIQAPGGPGTYLGAGLTVFDNAGLDSNPLPNRITVQVFDITGFVFSLNSAVSNSPGGPLSSQLSLNVQVESSSASETAIQVTAAATGYLFPPSGANTGLTSALGGSLAGPGSGSVTGLQWVDLGDGHFATTGPIGPIFTPGLQSENLSPVAFSNTASVGFTSTATLATPYSITDQLNLSFGGVGATAGVTLSSTVAPEPVTMFLGGTGLLMLTYAARRRLFGR